MPVVVEGAVLLVSVKSDGVEFSPKPVDCIIFTSFVIAPTILLIFERAKGIPLWSEFFSSSRAPNLPLVTLSVTSMPPTESVNLPSAVLVPCIG
ncbi:hypothetical protein MBAV_000268 [Candidatus Magnetobacterium bavaricum]|uniref:Uncharacterized protein n=1 Tax=Candidatus Magnetobacterium bavaricum TaxID=29290 RepID=A0A0F3GZY7_9BACT|nr:hypothetical protein MBAV_000268 [Candidatus Magnetobacterium bavaricum]